MCLEGLSWLQALVEGLLKEFPNTLVLRVRMPIVADLTYPRNFITKIIKYDRVHHLHGSNCSRP
jgi:3,5-epimerase/4-reductase